MEVFVEFVVALTSLSSGSDSSEGSAVPGSEPLVAAGGVVGCSSDAAWIVLPFFLGFFFFLDLESEQC
jgi:hypothetical protein